MAFQQLAQSDQGKRTPIIFRKLNMFLMKFVSVFPKLGI